MRDLARDCGTNDSGYTSSDTSAPLLQESATFQEFSFQEHTELRSTDSIRRKCEGGTAVVDRRGASMEWKADQLPDSRHDNRDRCFTARLGGYVGRNLDRRAMDGGREEVPYQLVGATRWCIRSKDVRQGQKQHPHTFEDGQYYCSSVHKPPGRNEVPSLGSLSMSSLAVVPAQRDHTLSRASTWDIQQYSGQRIPHLPFIGRVETAHHSLQSDLSMVGPMQGGPLCKQA